MDSALSTVDANSDIEALYRADADRLWRAVYAFASDDEIASEAVAEAFAQLIRRGDAVRDPAAWAWRAAFRIAAGALKARRASDGISVTTQGDRSHAEPGYLDRYGDPDLRAALLRLPDGQRAVVILFYYADLPIAQIAARLGSNRLAVRANLSRGRRRLRQLLGDHDG